MTPFSQIIFIVLIVCMPLFAEIIRVPADQPTIQAGINAAENGDTVLVDEGTYFENINFKGKEITVTSKFIMDEDPDHIANTIIDGSQNTDLDSGSVVYFITNEDTASVLAGFTITNGRGTKVMSNIRTGGGIMIENSGCKIINNIIINNECIYQGSNNEAGGGGISLGPPGIDAFVVIEGNSIQNNTVWGTGWTEGGGIQLLGNGRVKDNEIISNLCKSDNDKSVGGGIRITQAATVAVLHNIVANNSAVSVNSRAFAGGVSCSVANVILDDNLILFNSVSGAEYCHGAGIYFDLDNKNLAVVKKNYIKGNFFTNGNCYGGGIGMYRSTKLEIVNNIITDNSATYGGALHSWDNSKPVIINNTIVNNTAAQAGGALYSEDPSTYTILINTIMWDNIVTQIGNEIDIKNGNVAVSYCDIKGGWAGSGNRNTQPRFLNEDTLFHLDILDTVCINHGIDSVKIGNIWYFAPQTDYDGGSRAFLLSPPDIGAYETDVLPDGFESNNIFNTSCEFILNQNYPNPFNAETVIRYTLPVTCYLDLSIFNLLGQKIATLVSEKLPAGQHTVEFNAQTLPSGIYYYKLTADTYKQVRRMLLIK